MAFESAVVSGFLANVASAAIVGGVKAVKDAFGWEYPKPQDLQIVPDSGFVGRGIESARTELQIWLNEPEARVIGVSGMGGVGKTSLLQLIHNDCKEKVSTNFDFVIWNTVSGSQTSKIPLPNEEFDRLKIESLQYTIAESVGLDINGIASIDTRKMKLYASLKNKRFLLILDDVWRPIDLEQVGVNFGHDNSSRVLISCRNKFVVETMAANYQYFVMEIEPLSTEDGWDLFRRKAFRNGPAPDSQVEVIARDIAEECQGLPLALNIVAAAMALKTGAVEWRRALDFMRNVHPSLSSTRPNIHDQLYQRLKWSYNDLPSDLKMCFLYCAAFPEDERIPVETLVEMWTAESLVPQKGTSYYMDVGREYIKALVDRCLIQYDEEDDVIRVHDVLRDMAIYVGEKEEKGLYLSSQHLQQFPTEKETRDCKRISLLHNQISYLPTTDLRCQTLVSLVLAQNEELKQIPDRFFENLISLKVLDLSETAIEALPASVGQLGQLQCLHLRYCTDLKELPDRIGELKHLQFLNLSYCPSLKYLPDRIGELKHLKHLNLEGTHLLRANQICQLTSLNRLAWTEVLTPMSLEDLTNLSNLIELRAEVKPEIKGGSMSSWSEMRELSLSFSEDDVDDVVDLRLIFSEDDVEDDIVEDDAALDILPQNMQSMQKLERLVLRNYRGVSLPNCISRFQNLKELELCGCTNLKELPGLEIGSDAASDGFPMLEGLLLDCLDSLESIVWNENTMLKLKHLTIDGCPVLKSFRTEELPNLRQLCIRHCDELSNVSQIGSLPMLERLRLWDLDSLESIVWNENTMLPNLRELWIHRCHELSNVSQMGSLPMLETLDLYRLEKLESIAHWNDKTMLKRLSLSYLSSLESIVWNEKTMLKLQHLTIHGCRVLKSFRTKELPNLQHLTIQACDELIDVSEMGSLPMLETLTLSYQKKLESIAHWNDKTMPNLQNLRVIKCPMLKRLPKGLDKLSNLTKVEGNLDWWNGIVWENHHTVYGKVSQFFRET